MTERDFIFWLKGVVDLALESVGDLSYEMIEILKRTKDNIENIKWSVPPQKTIEDHLKDIKHREQVPKLYDSFTNYPFIEKYGPTAVSNPDDSPLKTGMTQQKYQEQAKRIVENHCNAHNNFSYKGHYKSNRENSDSYEIDPLFTE